MASVAGMTTVAVVAFVAFVADVAIVAATVLSLHLLMVANQEPSVSFPSLLQRGSRIWVISRADTEVSPGAVTGVLSLDEAGAISQGPRAMVAALPHALHLPPSPKSSGLLSLFPSEQEEAEIELVCTFGLLMVLLKATSLAHF